MSRITQAHLVRRIAALNETCRTTGTPLEMQLTGAYGGWDVETVSGSSVLNAGFHTPRALNDLIGALFAGARMAGDLEDARSRA